jgi:hypothetical protein
MPSSSQNRALFFFKFKNEDVKINSISIFERIIIGIRNVASVQLSALNVRPCYLFWFHSQELLTWMKLLQFMTAYNKMPQCWT